jgi:DNA-binding NarL/FixJ family response regulator
VVILDIDSHDRRTNRILRHLASSIPTARIIAHSRASSKRFVMRLLCLGVKGYVSGKEIVNELPEAIKAVMQGGVFLCPTASGALVNEYRKRAQSRKRIHATS